jgi:hypothetical protein
VLWSHHLLCRGGSGGGGREQGTGGAGGAGVDGGGGRLVNVITARHVGVDPQGRQLRGTRQNQDRIRGSEWWIASAWKAALVSW